MCQAPVAEVQGAVLDGRLGIAYPKPAKVGLYVSLALELVRRGVATQRGDAGGLRGFRLLLSFQTTPAVRP